MRQFRTLVESSSGLQRLGEFDGLAQTMGL